MKPFRSLAVLVLFCSVTLSEGCALSTDTMRLKGYDAYREGQQQTSREYFEQVVARDATDYKSHYYLGMLGLGQMNDPSYARRHFEIAYSIRQAKPDIAFAPQPGTTETYVPFPTRGEIVDGLAESIYRLGEHPQLFTFLNQVADQYGEPHDFLRLARYMRKVGDHDAARFAYVKAARAGGGKMPEPYVQLGEFLDEIGARGEALTAYRQAYYIDPKFPGLADKIRAHGMVPGPTVGLPPEQ